MRWLTAIRTGHDWCNYHQFNLFKTGHTENCDLCNIQEVQNFEHILLRCKEPNLTYIRSLALDQIEALYKNYLIKTTKDDEDEKKAYNELPHHKLGMYIFPKMNKEHEKTRLRIIDEVLFVFNYYKSAFK